MNNSIPKAIIYCRVSSQEQTKGTSLDGQKKACLEYAEIKDIKVVKTFVEKGESATAANRTELIKALDFCKEQKGAVTSFIVWKIDRFARNTTDHYGLKAQLMKYGVNLHSVTEPVSNDPIGKMTEAMLAGYAQFENDIRKQRCEGGMQRLIAQGIRPWHPPIGYTHSKTRVDKRKTQPDQPDTERFELIQRGLKEYVQGGMTLTRLTEIYNEWGLTTRTGKPMRKQLVDRVLQDKFYAGTVINPWTGEEFIGQHEPMITVDEFNQIQYVKKNGSRLQGIPHRSLNPDFPLRQFARCTCGGYLTGAWRQGRNKKYAYYQCRNKDCQYHSKGVAKDELENKFVELLTMLTPDKKFLRLFEVVVIDVWKSKHKTIKQEREKYQRELKKLEDRRENLLEMRMNGEVTKEEFGELKDKLDNQITGLQISSNESRIEELDVEAAVTYSVKFVRDLARQWQDMDATQKQKLQRLVLPEGFEHDKATGQCDTTVLSPIFALNKGFVANKKDLAKQESLLVAGVGLIFHQLIASISDIYCIRAG